MNIAMRQSILLIVLWCFFACTNSENSLQQIEKMIGDGKYSVAKELIDRTILSSEKDSVIRQYWIDRIEWMSRMEKEFPLTEDDVRSRLLGYYPELNDSMMALWENSGDLEMIRINGEKRYFNRSVSNFFRINNEAKALKISKDGEQYSGVAAFQQRYLPGLFGSNQPVVGKPFDHRVLNIRYTITLDANAVPEGEVVRCWMPYPRVGLPGSRDVELLSNSEKNFIIAPDSCLQRTVYMEKPAVKDSVTSFHVSYRVHTAAQWYDLKPDQVKPYDKNSDLYRKYTLERLPHIVLNDTIKQLAKSIVGDEKNPFEQVRLLYYWFDQNIPWAGALEYSVMSCIPEYVLKHKRGDCGMQTFLFISMARSLGIPCKWQSGWYLLPEEKNLHDWAEVYYEGIGWVPVDVSFKLVSSTDQRIREFYLNGLDSYRLIVNDDFARVLFPSKKYMRSEPYDFQRGELEWRKGNLYFDTWSYKMEIKEECLN